MVVSTALVDRTEDRVDAWRGWSHVTSAQPHCAIAALAGVLPLPDVVVFTDIVWGHASGVNIALPPLWQWVRPTSWHRITAAIMEVRQLIRARSL